MRFKSLLTAFAIVALAGFSTQKSARADLQDGIRNQRFQECLLAHYCVFCANPLNWGGSCEGYWSVLDWCWNPLNTILIKCGPVTNADPAPMNDEGN
ncbi:MAG: hypothetical protein DCC75_05860 [Proteobacteria bacterium]|nr:MAG: hypothetical protein DCC75_05860 [Pseudomonadota bacterium]